ncbi:MAG: hypothetical protein K6G26_07130 [Lachnospiraceae bacterium]|nr:hypothetical protein [Lachnospiraceae bacterium]
MKNNNAVIFLIAIILAAGVFLSPKLNYMIVEDSMENRELKKETVINPEIEYQYLYFTFNDENLVLNYRDDFSGLFNEIYYLDTDGKVNKSEIDSFRFNNNMSGTFVTIGKKNNEDKNITVCAKADTNETQGFSMFSNVCGNKEIPLELVRSGENNFILLRNGVPFTGNIDIYGKYINHENKNIEEGEIDFIDVRDQRNGFCVTVADSNETVIATYIAEHHMLFNRQHKEAMTTMWVFIISVALGIASVVILRRIFNICKKKL